MEKKRILIVDDTRKNIQVLANVLSIHYEVEYTTDGYEAIKWLKSEPFDLLLLDIMMPSIDGFQVCKILREDESLNDVPIIFITAKTDNESIIKGFQIGGQDYITKPFNNEELLERVRTHIELKTSKEKLRDVNKWLKEQVDIKTKELQNAYIELESLDMAKDEFLGLLSHELRTPLNGIIGFSDVLRQHIESEKLQNYLNLIIQSANRLVRFSHIATLITSIRTKNHEINISQIELTSFLETLIIPNLKDTSKNKNIDIRIKSNGKNGVINADKYLLKEMMNQILENAIKFSPENTEIIIDIKNRDKDVYFEIKDQGKGFSKMALDKIFKPFAYGQKHIDSNIGIGLYLVKLIVDTLDADINIGNNADKGAFVNITFPNS